MDLRLKLLETSPTQATINGYEEPWVGYVKNTDEVLWKLNNVLKWKQSGSVNLKLNGNSIGDSDSQLTNCFYKLTDELTSLDNFCNNIPNLESVDFSDVNTQNITSANSMFYGWDKTTLSIVLDGSTITSAETMFGGLKCESFTMPFITGFKPENISYMFFNCTQTTKLDLTALDTTNVTDMKYMFASCTTLDEIIFGSNFHITDGTTYDTMFSLCQSLRTITFNNHANDETVDRIRSLNSQFNIIVNEPQQ